MPTVPSMETTSTEDIPVFSSLGPRMSLFTPTDAAPGELIILCTWLGAAKKHILKYVYQYRLIAPHSRILLIQSSVGIITTRYTKQWEAIKPAAQSVRAVLSEVDINADKLPAKISGEPKIVIHTFSNGGTNSATQLLIELRSELGFPLPVTGIICDSGPAKGTYWKSYNSMILSLPKSMVFRIMGPPLIHCVCITLIATHAVGYDKPEDIFRRTLLDEEFVNCGRICYIFSKADAQVDWDDVVSHAEEARGKGWQVKEVLFQDTAHCNHVSIHGTEYFEAVRGVYSGEGLEI